MITSIGFIRTGWPAAMLLGVAAAILVSSCASGVGTRTGDAGTASKALSDTEVIAPEYQREGFISKDLYRIVIVAPADECPDMSYVDKTARQRAFMSLQKHLESRSKIVDQNTRARLLNLINEKGSVKNLDCRDPKRKAYSFEIERKNLSQYIDGLAAGQR